jgi:hypothetical protein
MPHLREHGYEAGYHDGTVVEDQARLQASANRGDEPRTRIDRSAKEPAGAAHACAVHASSLAGCSR